MALMTKTDAAAYLAISTRSLDRLIADRLIATVRVGRHLAFLAEDLDEFIARQRCEACPQIRLHNGTIRRRRSPA